MKRRIGSKGRGRSSNEYDEVKGVALNLTRSSEKSLVWEGADPVIAGAGQAVSATKTSAKPTPRGRRQHRVVQRQASNQASDDQGLLGNPPQWKYSSTWPNVKRGPGMAASRVMGTGVPQWSSDEAANPRRAKVPTVSRLCKGKHQRYSRSELERWQQT